MRKTAKSQRGNTIIIALIAIIALSGASAALLSVSVYRIREAVMAHENSRVFYTADAGIGASMAEITANHDYDNDGMGDVSGSFDGGNYSVCATDGGNDIWTITSTGTYNGYKRGIEVVIGRKITSPFEKAAFGGTSLSASGTPICDSYDSDDGTYASQVDGDHAGDNGTVGSNGDITVEGSATIYGDATPGPDGSVTGGGTVTGLTAPAEEETVLEPYTYTPVGSSLGQLNSTTTLASGTYRYSSIQLASWDTVTLGQNAGDIITLYVDSSIAISGHAKIVVYDGAKVVIHHGSDTAKFTGGGLVNTSQLPASFIFYSATTDEVKVAGNSDFYGAVYAPSAPVKITGTSAFFGSAVGNVVTISGTVALHYDDALSRLETVGSARRYEARSWREFPVQSQ
jgi:hypothetical protein